LEVLRPHIFFDDQRAVVEAARRVAPSVHVPYGELNRGVLPADPATDARRAAASDAPVDAPVGARGGDAAVPPAPRAEVTAATAPAGDAPAGATGPEAAARPGGKGTRELPLVRSVPGVGGGGLAGIAAVPVAPAEAGPGASPEATAPDAAADPATDRAATEGEPVAGDASTAPAEGP